MMSTVLCFVWELSNFTIVPTLQGFTARLIRKRAPQGPEDKECPWRRILKRCYKTITEVEIPELFQHQALRLIFGIQLQDMNVWVFWKGEGNSEPDTHFLYCRNNRVILSPLILYLIVLWLSADAFVSIVSPGEADTLCYSSSQPQPWAHGLHLAGIDWEAGWRIKRVWRALPAYLISKTECHQLPSFGCWLYYSLRLFLLLLKI